MNNESGIMFHCVEERKKTIENRKRWRIIKGANIIAVNSIDILSEKKLTIDRT